MCPTRTRKTRSENPLGKPADRKTACPTPLPVATGTECKASRALLPPRGMEHRAICPSCQPEGKGDMSRGSAIPVPGQRSTASPVSPGGLDASDRTPDKPRAGQRKPPGPEASRTESQRNGGYPQSGSTGRHQGKRECSATCPRRDREQSQYQRREREPQHKAASAQQTARLTTPPLAQPDQRDGRRERHGHASRAGRAAGQPSRSERSRGASGHAGRAKRNGARATRRNKSGNGTWEPPWLTSQVKHGAQPGASPLCSILLQTHHVSNTGSPPVVSRGRVLLRCAGVRRSGLRADTPRVA